jgi:hypothetical protein
MCRIVSGCTIRGVVMCSKEAWSLGITDDISWARRIKRLTQIDEGDEQEENPKAWISGPWGGEMSNSRCTHTRQYQEDNNKWPGILIVVAIADYVSRLIREHFLQASLGYSQACTSFNTGQSVRMYQSPSRRWKVTHASRDRNFNKKTRKRLLGNARE